LSHPHCLGHYRHTLKALLCHKISLAGYLHQRSRPLTQRIWPLHPARPQSADSCSKTQDTEMRANRNVGPRDKSSKEGYTGNDTEKETADHVVPRCRTEDVYRRSRLRMNGLGDDIPSFNRWSLSVGWSCMSTITSQSLRVRTKFITPQKDLGQYPAVHFGRKLFILSDPTCVNHRWKPATPAANTDSPATRKAPQLESSYWIRLAHLPISSDFACCTKTSLMCRSDLGYRSHRGYRRS